MKTFNESFFEVDTSDKYYVLGLLYSDGYLTKPKHGNEYVAIKLIDEQILYDINKKIGIDERPKNAGTTSAGNKLYIITITNPKMINDLKEIGLHQRKTFTIKYPNVPKEFVSDFVRGVFDGDGCIHFHKRKGRVNSIAKEFSILGTKDLLDGIANNLPCVSHIRTYRKIFKLAISSEKGIKTLFEFLYQNDNILKLNRKYNTFLNALSSIDLSKINQNFYIKREQEPRRSDIDYILEFKKTHGEKYDYSKFQFSKTRNKVMVICPKHGEFTVLPCRHITGQGCPECAKVGKYTTMTKTQDKFIKDAKEIHGDKFDYNKTDYVNNVTKILITCHKHGDFAQTPANHLQGRGCVECDKENKQKKYSFSLSEFIKKSKEIHGDKYDYSNTEYINIKTKIKIKCSVHGEFEQMPYHHLRGCGCSECSKYGRRSAERRKNKKKEVKE